MKKSLVAFILTLTLILGVLSAPAMAFYDGNWNQDHNKNYNHTVNKYRVISVSHRDNKGMLLKLNNWYANSNWYAGLSIKCINPNLKGTGRTAA